MNRFYPALAGLFLFLIIPLARGDNLVTNGDFSSGYLANVSLCNFNGGFFGIGASCSSATSNSNFLSPSNWTFNAFDERADSQTIAANNGSIFQCATAGAVSCSGLAFNTNLTKVSMFFAV